MFQRRWTEEAAFRVLAVIDCFHQKSKLPTEIFPFRHHGEETGWGLSFSAAAGGQAEAEVIAFEIRSDVEVAEMRRAVVRDGVCWRRHRSQEHHLPFCFRRAGWCWFLFVLVRSWSPCRAFAKQAKKRV